MPTVGRQALLDDLDVLKHAQHVVSLSSSKMMTSVVNTSGTFDGIPVPLPFIYVTVGIRVARAKVRHSVAASSPTKERRRLRLVGQPAALWFLSFRGRSNLSCTVRSPPVQPLSSSSRRYVRRTFSTKRKPSKTLNGQRNGRTAGVRACRTLRGQHRVLHAERAKVSTLPRHQTNRRKREHGGSEIDG